MKVQTLLTLATGMALITSASAAITIDWVNVGNPGNAADSLKAPEYIGHGAVSYAYKIGKYEVTNAQYGSFLNAKGASNSNGIYNVNMASYGITQSGSSGSFSYSVASGFENKPVVYVSWYDAARFANWLHNGQGSGDMEDGAYTLTGNTGLITVNPGAQIYLPSENEWYKAAYYQGDGTYSVAPGSRHVTTADANYNFSVGAITDVGTYAGYPSFYGTFDQGGNVWEWNDAVIGSSRGLRGGSWDSTAGFSFYRELLSNFRNSGNPSGHGANLGFRVASIPEPTSFVLSMLAAGMMLIRRNR